MAVEPYVLSGALENSRMSKEILIVDDEADIRMLTSGILQDEGYETREAGKSDEALKELEIRRPDLILLDIWLQGSELDGLQVLRRIKKLHAEVPVLMMSGHGTIETAVAAIKDGAYDFIEKPFKADRLLLIVARAIEAAELRRENVELRFRAGPDKVLVGTSRQIREIRHIIDQVAPTNSRVLISGPAGCGKKIVAKITHSRSQRAKNPLEILNCSSLSPERIDEELFGVEHISDNHSKASRVGAIGKLIRVLQEHAFQRLGGTSNIEVNVRFVATTSRNLEHEISAGRFRKDLFYRLNVVPITIPPLRERREDLPELATYFLQHSCEMTGRPLRSFAPEAIAMLQTYDWPGNVRELKNIVERMIILSPNGADTELGAVALPSEIRSTPLANSGHDWQTEVMGMSLRHARESFERHYLSRQLQRFEGNVSKTADFVGMERSALHRKLKSLAVPITQKMAGSKV